MENFTLQEQRAQLTALRSGDLASERSNEVWSEDEENQLERDFRDGSGISELCLRLKRSENAIIQRLQSMGLLTPPCSKYKRKAKRPKCPCPRCLENACPKYNAKDGKCYAGIF